VNDLIYNKLRCAQRSILDWFVLNQPGLGLDRRAEFFVSHFDSWLSPNSRILDIGGGWGFYAEPLQTRDHHVTVLDVINPALQHAPVVIYDGERIPFPDKSFDVSLLITVLHHIPDPVRVLKEARRVTRNHVIVIEDTFRSSLERWWTEFRDRMYNFEFLGHPNQFRSRQEWLDVFRRLDFEILETRELHTRLLGLRILNELFILGA